MSPVSSTHESLTVELQVNERDNDGVVTTVNDNEGKGHGKLAVVP
jgi:hypothetical protein